MDEKDIHEHLDAIEGRLGTIEKKLADKWVLPVSIAVLTFALGIATFLIQRTVNNSDVNKKKEQETIGTFLGETKVAFYRSCKDSLIKIDDHFQSYCQIGQEKEVLDALTNTLAKFRKFREAQTVIDQDVLTAVTAYAEFVAERCFDISSGPMDQSRLNGIYNESKALSKEANDKLTAGINALKAE
jgi:hypothetical protein